MTNAQTEARAIAEQLANYTYTLDPNVVFCDRRVVDEAVTALAAKGAELADANAKAERQWEGWVKEEALRKAAEAHLAEANKALCEIGEVAVGRDALDGFPRNRDEKQRRLVEIADIARRALEAQGGENG